MRTLLACLVAFLGCAPKGPQIDVIRMSTIAPPRAAGCKVEFINAPPAAAMLLLQQLGMISVQYEGEIDQPLLDRVRDKACALGGDIVTLNVGMQRQSGGIVQFLVFKGGEEQKPAAPEKKTTTEL